MPPLSSTRSAASPKHHTTTARHALNLLSGVFPDLVRVLSCFRNDALRLGACVSKERLGLFLRKPEELLNALAKLAIGGRAPAP